MLSKEKSKEYWDLVCKEVFSDSDVNEIALVDEDTLLTLDEFLIDPISQEQEFGMTSIILVARKNDGWVYELCTNNMIKLMGWENMLLTKRKDYGKI